MTSNTQRAANALRAWLRPPRLRRSTRVLRFGPCALAALLLLLGCTIHEDGTSIEVLVGGSATSPGSVEASITAESLRMLDTDRGYHVTLDHAYLVLSQVELVQCAQAQTAGLLDRLRGLFAPSIAHAHGLSTPTVWAVPHVLDLLDANDRDVSVARMRPPAGRYCAANVVVAAADSDAENLPDDVPMVGRSIQLMGHFTAPGETNGHAFHYETSAQSSIALSFVNTAGQPMTLSLSSDRLMGELRMELGYRVAFNGLALIAGEYEPHAVRVLDNLLQNARAVVTQANSSSEQAADALAPALGP